MTKYDKTVVRWFAVTLFVALVLVAVLLASCAVPQGGARRAGEDVPNLEECPLVAKSAGLGTLVVYRCEFGDAVCFVSEGYQSGGVSCLPKEADR